MVTIRRMRSDDLSQVNTVFAKAFSSARLQEGLKNHRVSPCRPEFLRMYLDRGGEGALVAVDRKRVAGFNFCHMYGSTGWMGPLAVLPGYQDSGVGKALVGAGLDHFMKGGAGIIGLETMPRNFRNIGFYMRLGFEAGPLCIDMVASSDAPGGPGPREADDIVYFSEVSDEDKRALLDGVGGISEELAPGLDYRGEVLLNMNHEYGDTVMLVNDGGVAAFAVCHLRPYGQFEEKGELKVNVLAVRPHRAGDAASADESRPSEDSLDRLSALLSGVRRFAARERLRAVRVHARLDKDHAVKKLIALGYNVAYSDLRLWLGGFRENEPGSFLHLCRWQ